MESIEYLNDYRRSSGITRRKLREYIPTMMLTNLSTLLMLSVDSIVVGNLVGSDALSSVNIFGPITLVIGSLTILASNGISTGLATAMGRSDVKEINSIKGSALRIMVFMALLVGLLQIPTITIMINSYHLSDALYRSTWQYAIGMMISYPVSIITTIGTYQLQISGRMKVLMRLTVLEGITNLVFDLIYIQIFHLGVKGAGFGSATACVIRCIVTVFYLAHYTDMYKCEGYRFNLREITGLFRVGLPDASYHVVSAAQSYIMIRILLMVFGESGPVINGVCSFCGNVIFIFVGGITGGLRPLIGLYAGADDKKGLRILMKQGAAVNLVSVSAVMIAIELFPKLMFDLHGVKEIPAGGILCVRIFVLCFVLKGFNSIIRLYLVNRKDSRYATLLTVFGNATLPVFAFIIMMFSAGPWVFFSHTLTQLIIFVLSAIRYNGWINKDRKEIEEIEDQYVLYMTVRPEQAVPASRDIRRFAEEKGIELKVSYRVALCMEEMVAYADRSSGVRESEIQIKFTGKDRAIFIVLDEGQCLSFEDDPDIQSLITSHHRLISKFAKDVEYQYLMNMNFTKFVFTA